MGAPGVAGRARRPPTAIGPMRADAARRAAGPDAGRAAPARAPATAFIEGAGALRQLTSSAGGTAAPFSSRDMILRGTAVAAIVAVPSLSAFGMAWSVLGDFVAATVAGIAVHLAGMALAGRIYRRLFGSGAGR